MALFMYYLFTVNQFLLKCIPNIALGFLLDIKYQELSGNDVKVDIMPS